MKSKTTAGILAIFLWWLWIHKFYLGQTVAWIIYLLFCWTWIPSIIWIIEWIIILTHSDDRRNEKYNSEWVKENIQKKYDELLKLDELKEKWYITAEEYKEKVKTVKEEIKQAEEKSKKAKENIKKYQEKEIKNISKIWKIIWWIAIWICLLFVWIYFILSSSQNNKVENKVSVLVVNEVEEIEDTEEEIPILVIDDDDEYWFWKTVWITTN